MEQGMALRSGPILVLLGLGQLVDAFISVLVILNLENEAIQRQNASTFGAVLATFSPVLISSTFMLSVGTWYVRQGEAVPRRNAMSMYALHLAAEVLKGLLFRLDIVQRTCAAQESTVTGSTTIVTSMLFAAGFLLEFGASPITATLALLIGALTSSSLYLVVRSVLHGSIVDPLEEVFSRCEAILGSIDNAGYMNSPLSIANLIVSGMYVVHFALSQYIGSGIALASLRRVDASAQATK